MGPGWDMASASGVCGLVGIRDLVGRSAYVMFKSLHTPSVMDRSLPITIYVYREIPYNQENNTSDRSSDLGSSLKNQFFDDILS